MRFSEQWLRTWVNPPCDAVELGSALTMAGLELDQLLPAGPSLQEICVAKVRQLSQHPTAPRLKICQIDAGQENSIQVVCGAPNVKEGGYYPYAAPGVTLPGGQLIEQTEIRETASAGMLCSAAELGLEEHSAGLLELDGDRCPGESLNGVLALDDTLFEIDLTPNRADCLSVLGVAREVSAIFDLPAPNVLASSKRDVNVEVEDRVDVNLLAGGACAKYLGCVLKEVDATALAPLWLRERLRRSGQRSINVVVDVLNYVMLELGQPMHAFDLNKLQGGIQVRWGKQSDEIVLLDGQTIEGVPDTMVIADDHQVLALAGIMGGLDSAVTEQTRDIFLECAYFDPIAIAGKARALGLHTESSHRYERGVDPELQQRALYRAVELIQEFAGGKAGPSIEQVLTEHLPAKPSVLLDCEQVRRMLGLDLTDEQILSILSRIGCDVKQNGEIWQVEPPSHRFDIHVPVDLVEEVARLYGYDAIESQPILPSTVTLKTTSEYSIESVLADLMVSLGYREAIGFSFNEPAKNQHCDGNEIQKVLSNPISTELSAMRTSLWPGLCQMLAYNVNRQQENIRLFEIGTKFIPVDGGVNELAVLAGIVSGQQSPTNWNSQSREISFYDVKGVVEWLLDEMGIQDWRLEAESVQGLHPGQSAKLYLGEEELGRIGVLHPQTAAEFGIERERPIVFELLIDQLSNFQNVESFQMWSKFPVVRRDIALEVDEALAVAELTEVLSDQRIEPLQSIRIFDVYQGKGVPEGRKSVALGLILQEFSRTLRDKEIEQIVNQLVTVAEQRFGAKLRNA